MSNAKSNSPSNPIYRYALADIDIQGGKIWIQHNIMEELIADDLMKLGIDRHDIVLGLHHLSVRPYTDFATV